VQILSEISKVKAFTLTTFSELEWFLLTATLPENTETTKALDNNSETMQGKFKNVAQI
jgi:hypothetical protein